MKDHSFRSYEHPLSDGGGKPIRGPEVEFEEATKRELRRRLDEIERCQLNMPLELQQLRVK